MAELIYSRRALASILNQIDYLGERNTDAANSVLADISRTCDLISEFPLLGRAITGIGLRYHLTRKFRYRVVFRIYGDVLEIRDVLHPRQK